MTSTKTFKRTHWNVERGSSSIVGFESSALAHAQAKPIGFRKQGTVIRVETTRTWVDTDDVSLTTEYTTRTVESGDL